MCWVLFIRKRCQAIELTLLSVRSSGLAAGRTAEKGRGGAISGDTADSAIVPRRRLRPVIAAGTESAGIWRHGGSPGDLHTRQGTPR